VVDASVLEAYDPTPECVQVPEPSCASVDTDSESSPQVVSSTTVTGDVITGAEVIIPDNDMFSVSAAVALTVILPERFPEDPLVILVYIVVSETVPEEGSKVIALEKLMLSSEI
jgi:hypothetical protein